MPYTGDYTTPENRTIVGQFVRPDEPAWYDKSFNVEEEARCNECGESITASSAKTRCGSCGAVNKIGFVFEPSDI